MATVAKAEGRAPGPTTVEELEAWMDAPPGEIVDGMWVPKYPDGKVTGSGGWHGVVTAEIAFLLKTYVRQQRLGIVMGAEAAFLLRRGPDLMRCADAAFIATARLTAGVPVGAFRGAPDLAVEVRSPWDRRAKIARKVQDYLHHGTRAVWDVDPKSRTVTVHLPGVLPRHLTGDDPLDGGDVLPGFSAPASALFVDLDPPA
jgi:Uma2 family endonuclease